MAVNSIGAETVKTVFVHSWTMVPAPPEVNRSFTVLWSPDDIHAAEAKQARESERRGAVLKFILKIEPKKCM